MWRGGRWDLRFWPEQVECRGGSGGRDCFFRSVRTAWIVSSVCRLPCVSSQVFACQSMCNR